MSNNEKNTNLKEEKQRLLVVVHVQKLGKKKNNDMVFTFLEKKFKNEEIKQVMVPAIKMKESSNLDDLFLKISTRKSTIQIKKPDYVDTFDYKDARGQYTVILYCIKENEHLKRRGSLKDDTRHLAMHQIMKYPGAITPLSKECAIKVFNFLWEEQEKNKPQTAQVA